MPSFGSKGIHVGRQKLCVFSGYDIFSGIQQGNGGHLAGGSFQAELLYLPCIHQKVCDVIGVRAVDREVDQLLFRRPPADTAAGSACCPDRAPG